MENQSGIINPAAMFKLSYGLFVLTARDGDKDNGCIINTAAQLTSAPQRLSITVNKANFTHGMIIKTGEFNVSILTQLAAFAVFEQFGFHSGKDTDKFAGMKYVERTANGITHLSMGPANAVISAKVKETVDCGTHTLFVADVTQTLVLSDVPSATYQFYFDFIKPKPTAAPQQASVQKKKKGFACKICGYVHEGDSLPEDFVCPICKHGAADFEPL